MTIKTVLHQIFNHDFATTAQSSAFHRIFFEKTWSAQDLHVVFDDVRQHTATFGNVTIPAALRIPGKTHDNPFAVLAQLHGNEPAGLAGIALVMALSQAGMLERDVIVAIGNPLAAAQYFAHWLAYPDARQEMRDAYRCGLRDDGTLRPDMNRIPVDFATRPTDDPHIKRAQELYALGQQVCGILDIHSARGNMLCITDHKHASELRNSSIRSVLTGLADAISAHASAAVTVQTLKTILAPLPNIQYQVGIEAGRHEAPDSPHHAAEFTLCLLHTIGLTSISALTNYEDQPFDVYRVNPRLSYADLAHADTLSPDDKIYMATPCQSLPELPARSDTLIVRGNDGDYVLQPVTEWQKKPLGTIEYALYQYDEMEAIAAHHTVAVALPSGTAFQTPCALSGIFVSKSAALYDKDPAVGPWPVAVSALATTKFCYPCDVSRGPLP